MLLLFSAFFCWNVRLPCGCVIPLDHIIVTWAAWHNVPELVQNWPDAASSIGPILAQFWHIISALLACHWSMLLLVECETTMLCHPSAMLCPLACHVILWETTMKTEEPHRQQEHPSSAMETKGGCYYIMKIISHGNPFHTVGLMCNKASAWHFFAEIFKKKLRLVFKMFYNWHKK